MRRMIVCLVVLGSCAEAEPEEDPAVNQRLLDIARNYGRFGRVDDQTRWAPALCRAPSPSTARFSRSKDERTHGRKLYFMFASNRAEYVKAGEQPVGQTIVKEAWIPVPADGDQPNAKPDASSFGRYLPYAKRDGRLYRADQPAELFIMERLDPATTGTDNGWIYSVVSADRKRVIASGRLKNCMGCHTEEEDRVFGLK